MFHSVHWHFLPHPPFLPPHPRCKTVNCSAVAQPTKILCQLSSTFRHPPTPRPQGGLSPGSSCGPGAPRRRWACGLLCPVLALLRPSEDPWAVSSRRVPSVGPGIMKRRAGCSLASVFLSPDGGWVGGALQAEGCSGEAPPQPAWLHHGRAILVLCSLLTDNS